MLALTVELGLLERLDLADVDVLHRVDALHGLEDLSGDVLGDAEHTRVTRTETERGCTTAAKKAGATDQVHQNWHDGVARGSRFHLRLMVDSR